jgi:transcriptional regulator with GAF, ATPase, and Fis domain
MCRQQGSFQYDDRLLGLFGMALEQAGWVQAKAARLLGMTPRQIAYRIQIMKINVRKM